MYALFPLFLSFARRAREKPFRVSAITRQPIFVGSQDYAVIVDRNLFDLVERVLQNPAGYPSACSASLFFSVSHSYQNDSLNLFLPFSLSLSPPPLSLFLFHPCPLLFPDRRSFDIIAILRAGLLRLHNKYRSANNEYNI